MFRLILIILFAIAASHTFAQGEVKKNKKKLVLNPGVSYQKQFFVELNLIYADAKSLSEKSHNGPVVAGSRFGIEYNCNPVNTIVAPKIGYELSGQLICVRANTVYYIGKHYNDLRLSPEIGFSLLGAINLTYGIGIPLLNQRINEVSKSRITLSFNCNKNLWRQL
jgi:hypothetical protein